MRVLALVSLALLAAGGASSLPPVTQVACADAPTPVTFATWGTQLENLAFDGAGSMYVSDLGGDRLLRYAPDGSVEVVANVPGMHGTTMGPDGRLYVGASGESGIEVWRFDGDAHEVYARGLPTANGLAFDADGDLFVSNPLGTAPPYLVRVPRADPAAWHAWWDGYGPNGLWVDGDALYTAITGDQSSPILRLSTSDPTKAEVVARLSYGAATLQPGAHAPEGTLEAMVPKGLDDLTLGPDGMLYVAAHVTGEVLRVDPATGAACVLASGLNEPTSLRFAHGFGEHDGKLFVTDMGGVGVTALAGPASGTITTLDLDLA